MTMSPRIGLAALTLMLLPPGAVQAQESGQEEAGPPPRVDTELVFEREVFSYPTFDRRNPFQTLVSSDAGPRFEQMQLTAIIYSPEPGQSMAMLAAGRTNQASSAEGVARTGRTQRLRVGDRWGNVRIVEIRERQVVVVVEEFGLTEQRIMELPTRGQGGSR